MNVTIPTQLEDTLVEEITAHEHGECQIDHDPDFECTVTAVAIVNFDCDDDGAQLACRVITDHMLGGIGSALCENCERNCEDCWSVVLLP